MAPRCRGWHFLWPEESLWASAARCCLSAYACHIQYRQCGQTHARSLSPEESLWLLWSGSAALLMLTLPNQISDRQGLSSCC